MYTTIFLFIFIAVVVTFIYLWIDALINKDSGVKRLKTFLRWTPVIMGVLFFLLLIALSLDGTLFTDLRVQNYF